MATGHLAPVEQAAGYQQIFKELEEALCRITGISFKSTRVDTAPIDLLHASMEAVASLARSTRP